jgi:hypothetical protein
MSSAGTLLSELDSKGPSGQDSDLVEKILADMNGGGGGGGNQVQMPSRGMAAPPPPLPSQTPPGMIPQGNTTFAQAADPMMAQAHLIGRDHPTPADFAAAMHGGGRGSDNDLWPGGAQQQRQPSPDYYDEPKKNWYARIIDEMKTPLVIAMIFFVLSLPAVNLLIAHYVPYLVLPTGNLSFVGIGAKSLLAGASFWVLFNIVAPLLKS